jgi:hypothetical protein
MRADGYRLKDRRHRALVKIEGIVDELYDVVVLPRVRRPMVLGLKTDEIRRSHHRAIDHSARLVHRHDDISIDRNPDMLIGIDGVAGQGRFVGGAPSLGGNEMKRNRRIASIFSTLSRMATPPTLMFRTSRSSTSARCKGHCIALTVIDVDRFDAGDLAAVRRGGIAVKIAKVDRTGEIEMEAHPPRCRHRCGRRRCSTRGCDRPGAAVDAVGSTVCR